MESSEYKTMFDNEDTHWWFRGTRSVILDYSGVHAIEPALGRPRILDVGCGTGKTAIALKEVAQVAGIDIDPGAVAFCKQRGLHEVVQGVAEAIPFEDNSFDMVFALDVIEHLDDDQAGLREFLRVLKPAGQLVVTVPAYEFLWSQHDVALHHRRRYTYQRLVHVLGSAGFQTERASYYNTLLFPLVAAVRLKERLLGYSGPATSNVQLPARWLNTLLLWVLSGDRFALRFLRFPFGVSLISAATATPASDEA